MQNITVIYSFKHPNMGFQNSVTVQAIDNIQALEKAKEAVSETYGSKMLKRFSFKINEVFIEFLNKDKGFSKDRIDFPTYQHAISWGRKELENFNLDMIKFY